MTGQTSSAPRYAVSVALARSTVRRLRSRPGLLCPPLAIHQSSIRASLSATARGCCGCLLAVAAPLSVTMDRATFFRPTMLRDCGSRAVFHTAGSGPALHSRPSPFLPPTLWTSPRHRHVHHRSLPPRRCGCCAACLLAPHPPQLTMGRAPSFARLRFLAAALGCSSRFSTTQAPHRPYRATSCPITAPPSARHLLRGCCAACLRWCCSLLSSDGPGCCRSPLSMLRCSCTLLPLQAPLHPPPSSTLLATAHHNHRSAVCFLRCCCLRCRRTLLSFIGVWLAGSSVFGLLGMQILCASFRLIAFARFPSP